MFLFKNSKRKIKLLIILIFLAGFFWALNDFIQEEKTVDYLSHLKELELKEVKKDFYAFKTKDGNPIKISRERDSEPYLQLEKWEGEVSLKVKIPFKTRGSAVLKDNRLVYSTNPSQNFAQEKGIFSSLFAFAKSFSQKQNEEPRIDFNFYPRESEDGGIEFDAVLYEKPKSNKLIFPMETEGLEFYYQGELTQKEKEQGASQPENVVGSYAVYHESKKGSFVLSGGKDYKTGKAFHIYRPKIKDSDNNECWGNISIENNYLIVEISQEFLDKAIYPVIIDPYFGYTSYGANWQSIKGRLSGLEATMGIEVGYAETAFYAGTSTTPAADYFGIYTISDSGLIASSSLLEGGCMGEFCTINFGGLSDIASGVYLKDSENYILAVTGDDLTGKGGDIKYDASGGGGGWYSYASCTDSTDCPPMFATSFATEDRLYSIYVEYTSPITNIIPVGYQQYTTSSVAVDYDSLNASDLTPNWQKRIWLDLPKPTGSPSTSTEDLYWGIMVPSSTNQGQTFRGSSTVEVVAD